MAKSETRDVSLTGADGKPRIEVIFGHANVGGYRLFRWDANGQNPVQIGEGKNTDPKPDIFFIGPDARDLNGHFVSIEAKIVTPADPPGPGPYSVIVETTQDGSPSNGGRQVYDGQLDANGVAAELQYLKFAVI